MSGYTLIQEQALAIVPKVMSSISIPCSIFIIHEVYCDYKTRGTTPVQRALVGMSTVDILASSAWFLSTWAVPRGSFAFATGNRTSCNFQGFLLQLAIGAPLYNCSLALFYLLMIKQRWTDDQLARIEWWVHAFILSFTIGTSILLLQIEQYNHIGAVCWVIGEPAGCGNSSYQGSDVPCERGNYAWAWGLALFYGPLWVCVIGCASAMVILYLEVRKTHTRSRSYSVAIGMQHNLSRSGSDSSRVAIQAILYCLSFVITWMPSTLWSIAHWFSWGHYGLDMAAASAEPLQGMWNMLIFLKARPKSVHKIKQILSTILPCIFSAPSDEYYDPYLSFSTGLRRGRFAHSRASSSRFGTVASANSNLSGNFSSGLMGNHSSGHFAIAEENKKQAHRNTASTEALDDLKEASVRDLDCDISGFGEDREEKLDSSRDCEAKDIIIPVDCMLQLATTMSDDESQDQCTEEVRQCSSLSDHHNECSVRAQDDAVAVSESSGDLTSEQVTTRSVDVESRNEEFPEAQDEDGSVFADETDDDALNERGLGGDALDREDPGGSEGRGYGAESVESECTKVGATLAP